MFDLVIAFTYKHFLFVLAIPGIVHDQIGSISGWTSDQIELGQLHVFCGHHLTYHVPPVDHVDCRVSNCSKIEDGNLQLQFVLYSTNKYYCIMHTIILLHILTRSEFERTLLCVHREVL